MNIVEKLLQARLVAILRGDYSNQWQIYADALIAGGIPVLEITLNSPGALAGMQELKSSHGDRIILGAGTVLSAEQAHAAIDAGAQFIVAPDTDEAMIKVCTSRNVPVLPGAYTPTEIKRAYQLGAAIVKVFPVPDPAYIKAVRGPLDHIPIMVTGGVNIDNVADFLKAGANAAGLGSNLAKPGLSADEITARASAFVTAIKGVT